MVLALFALIISLICSMVELFSTASMNCFTSDSLDMSGKARAPLSFKSASTKPFAFFSNCLRPFATLVCGFLFPLSFALLEQQVG